MTIRRRPVHRGIRLVPQLHGLLAAVVLVATTISGCGDSSTTGAGPSVSLAEAIEACEPCAERLGITGTLRGRLVNPPLGGVFGYSYVVETEDGAHQFCVGGYSGEVVSYENVKLLTAMGLRPGDPGDFPDLDAEALATQKRVGRLLFPGFDWQRALYFSRGWHEIVGPGVLSGNRISLLLDGEHCARFLKTQRELMVDVEPRLTPAECINIALSVARHWPGVRQAWPLVSASGPSEYDRRLKVHRDAIGVQRLVYRRWFLASRDPAAGPQNGRGPARADYHVFLLVDASTGECFPCEREPPVPREIEGERLPLLTIAGQSLGELGPVFPPRLVKGVPYLYVGYLQSYLWHGIVEADARQAQIAYGEVTWRVVADESEVSMNDERRTRPRKSVATCTCPQR